MQIDWQKIGQWLPGTEDKEGQKEGITKRWRKAFQIIDLFIILIVLMLSYVWMYVHI